MKLQGKIFKDEIDINLDVTGFISELLKNEEFKQFTDKSHVFNDILNILESHNDKLLENRRIHAVTLKELKIIEKKLNNRINYIIFGIILMLIINLLQIIL